LSALCGAAVVYVVYVLFKKISNEKTAFYVAILSVFSSVLAYHAAEVRPYSLLVLIFFSQVYVFLLMLEKKNFWYYFWFSFLGLALVLTQYLGFIILFGEGIYLLVNFKKYFKVKNVLVLFVPVILFALIWGKSFFAQITGRLGEQSQSLSLKDNLTGVFSALYRFGSGRIFLDLKEGMSSVMIQAKTEPITMVVFALSLVVPIFLFGYGIYLSAKKKDRVFYLFISLVAPLFLAACASSEIGPRAVRYMLFLVPFYLYFIVYSYFSFKNFYLKGLFVIFLLIYVSAYVNGAYFERKRAGINTIAAYLMDNGNDGDAILIRGGYGGGEEWVLRYYLGQKQSEFRICDMYGDYSVGNLRTLKSRLVEDKLKLLKDAAPTVWFYDMTYAFKPSEVTYSFDRIHLGQDKEDKELSLYKF
jgi:hypothetical protein